MSNVFVFRRPPHGVITEYFGGGKGGSTTTTNNVTQIPPEVLARYNAVNARAETVAQAPYQAYSQDPNAFVAPLSQTQQAGIQNTNAMAGAAQPYYGAATGLAAQSTGSVNPSGLNVGQYMNPYTQSVVNATQAAMNQQQGQQLSQQQAEAIKGGAFGGERAGLQRAQLMGQQGLAQAQAIAPLYQQNYNQALAAAQQQQGVGLGAEQANRQNLQNAAQLFGSIGTNAQQAGLAGAQAQLAAGQQQQQTQQAGLQALYNQFQQQQGFPYQQAQFLANIATGTGALSGNASSGTSTTTGGGGFFSDERLKENIKKVGETNDGQPIYRYNYKGDKNTQIGLLAQDVEKDHPEAVGSSQGYKTVNYKKATEDAVRKQGGGGLMPQMLTPEIEAGDVSPEFEAGDVTPENMDAAYGTNTPKSTFGWGPRQDAAVALRGSWRDLPASRLTNTPDDRNYGGSEAMRNAPGARYGRAIGGDVSGLAGGNPAVSGVDTYRIDAPSAMLRENSGKGLGAMPSLPQAFMGGRDIPIEAGASGAGLAAMGSPTVTGFAPGVREGKEAELASLQSSMTMPPGPNGELLGSGKPYLESRIGTLQEWLNKNNSQGGLVSGPGNFARGGLAEGDYMNPALAYYSPQQAQGGLYGAQLQPLAQRQILQGTPMQAPQQRQQPDAVAAAMNMAKLVEMGNKARPDFLRSDADIAARKQTADALAAREQRDIEWAREKGYQLPSDAKAADKPEVPEEARGGLIGDRHHYSRGGINPYGGNSVLGPILEEQEQQPQPQMMKADNSNKQQPKQQESNGLGDVMKAKSMYDTGNKAYKWGADKLGADKAMSATSTEAVPTALESAPAPSGGVIDLTTAAPGLGAADTAATGAGLAGGEAAAAGATAAETAAAAATAAEVAAAAEAAAAAAAAAGTTATVGATVAEAAPFLLAFLSDERAKHDIKKVGKLYDGQPVYRFAYNGDDRTQMGLLAQKVEKGHPEAVGLAGGMKTVDYKRATDAAAKRGHYQTAGGVPVNIPELVPENASSRFGTDTGQPMTEEDKANALIKTLAAQTIAEKAPAMDRRPVAPVVPVEAAAKPIPTPANAAEPARAAAPPKPSKPFLPEITSKDVKDTLSSENFWVPAIAGIGSMLASPNKTLGAAIGSGLVGGTTAYTGLQKQQSEIAKREAETRGLDVLNYQRSVQQTPAGNIAWLADGSIMLLGDYDTLQRAGKAPPLLGRIPDNADVRLQKWLIERSTPKPLEAPAPKATAPAAAPAAAPKAAAQPEAPKKTAEKAPEAAAPAAPATPEPKKVQADYDDKSKELADRERVVALNAGPASETAKDVTKRYVASVTPSATAARDSQRYLSELASNLADATKGKGLDAPGFGFSGRAQFTSALNTLSRAFGGKGEFGQADTINEINNKLETLQASISAAGGGQESVSALQLLRKAVAGPSMSPRAYSQLAGDLLATNQRAIDRDIHMSKYAKDSQGLLADAGQDFERTHDAAMYKREGDAVSKMILQQPELIKDLRSGKYTSQQIDDAFAKQGLRNMSRYFVGRT
jgi:outer membrane biosynthesis protein TonB